MVSVAVCLWALLFVIVVVQSFIERYVKHPVKQATLSQALFIYATVTFMAAVGATVIVAVQHILGTQ